MHQASTRSARLFNAWNIMLKHTGIQVRNVTILPFFRHDFQTFIVNLIMEEIRKKSRSLRMNDVGRSWMNRSWWNETATSLSNFISLE